MKFTESVSALDVRIQAHIKYSSLQMENLLEDFMKARPHVRRIMDLGCGSGNYSDLFAKKAAIYTGFDANAGLLEQARQKCARLKLDNVLFLQWDMNHKLPFVAKSFDFIFSGYSAYYVEKAEPLVQNLHEILDEGGEAWFIGPVAGNAVELDRIGEALFGVAASPEKDIRMGRLQGEFAPLFRKIFGNCEVSEKDFSVNFPNLEEYAKYYFATPQYVELTEKFGKRDPEAVMAAIKSAAGLKLTKKSIFLSVKK